MNYPAFFCFPFFLTLTCLSVTAQADQVATDQTKSWEKDAFLRGTPISYREEILKQLQWSWTCIGPNIQPAELNPGGKAIPAYAAGRGNGTGRINYLFIHPEKPDHLWACSPTGGVWRTTDNGESWAIAGTDQLPISGVSSIAVDRKKTDRWAIATGDGDDVFMFTNGIWITEDGGTTYQQINGQFDAHQLPFGLAGDGDGQISEVITRPRKLKKLFVASNRGVWVSSGKLKPHSITWDRVIDGRYYDMVYIPSKSARKDIIAAAGNGLIVSYNAGKTWEEMPRPEYPQSDRYTFLRITLAHSPADPTKLYAAVTCSEGATQSSIGEGTLQVFDLVEKKWTFIRSLKSGMNNVIPTRARAFAVSPADQNVMICGNVQPLFRSTDGGLNFSKIEKNQMHDDCHHIVFSPDGKTVWSAHDGGVSRSTNGGLNFSVSDKGIGAANVFGLSVAQTTDQQVAFGGYDTGGNVLRDGKWWHVSWGDGFETITHPANRDVVFTTMQNGAIQRSTSGTSFEDHASPSGSKTEWHTWIRMHPVNHSTIYCSGTRLMRSQNLGEAWEPILNAKELDSTLVNVYRFFLSADHPGVMYAYILDKTGVQPQIWRSINITEQKAADIKWERAAEVPVAGWIMSIAIDPDDPRKYWLLYNRTETTGKMWYYNGAEYEDHTANLGLSRCESMILQRGADKRLYLGSSYGVFTRKTGESQWTLLAGLPGTYIKSLDINYAAGKLVVGTYGRGIWQGDLVRK